MMRKSFDPCLLALLTSLSSFFPSLSAQVVVYEPFDYPATGTDGDGVFLGSGSQNGGTGFSGGWSQLINDVEMEVTTGGLSFTDSVGRSLGVTGNYALRSARSGYTVASRSLSTSSVNALTSDNSTLWISFLYVDHGVSGPDSSLVLTSTQLALSNDHTLNSAGYGVGIMIGEPQTGANARVETAYYLNATASTRSASQLNPNDSEGTPFLLAAKINWKPDGTPDEIFVFNITDLSSEPAESEAIASDTFDMPLSAQQSLSMLNIGETQVDGFDEIRLGVSFTDVSPHTGDPQDPDPNDPDPSDPSDAEKPNVIYIITDDMGYSDIGAYGGEIDTPHIDSLASAGMRFRQYYNNAKCETTRTSVMTGLYHGRGSNTSGGATLAEAVKTVGYRTYAVGKWHLGTGSNIPVQQGFDRFYGFYSGSVQYFPAGIGATEMRRDTAESGNYLSAYPDSSFNTSSGISSYQTSFDSGYYQTDALGDNAVTFIKDAVENHPDQPFFLYLAFNAPHTPLQAPLDLINKYRGSYMQGWDVLREEKWQRQKEKGIVDPHWQLPHLRADIPKWSDLSAAEQDREDHRRSVYSAMMDCLDQNVGKVLQQLIDSGIEDNTLVIFTGDNGAQAFDNTSNKSSSPSLENSRWSMGPAWAAFSNTPFRYYKQSQQQGGICTPFIARWPGVIEPNSITDQPGHIVDVMATLVDVSGADYDSLTKNNGNPVPPMDGSSLMPILRGGTRPAPDFWGFEYNSSEFGVIQGDWKLAAFSSSPWRLYNLKDDRTETRNLRWEYPDKVTELAALYDQWAVDTYGNTSRTYAQRDTRDELTQELRYSSSLANGLWAQPGTDITLSDIGSGTASTMNDHWEFYLTATSASGIDGNSDSVTFAHRAFCGDGYLSAQIESMSDLTADGSAGVMLRQSETANSAHFMLSLKANGDLVQSVRSTAGASETTTVLVSNLTLPLFIKVARAGNEIIPSYSADHQTWTDLTAVSVSFPLDLLAGLAAASGDNDIRATVTFREWETRHVATYPTSLRRDGLSEYLAFALGVGPNGNGYKALPELHLVESEGSSYPELHFNRRVGMDPNDFIIRWLGSDLSLWQDDSSEWQTMLTTPNPDGISEKVELRRSSGIEGENASFYSLEVQPK
ncbi:arylsulfatase [Verrucomicrobiaceae bacterium 5K15]|uniref:Arylsulfatase n=1 Tax=Oceaniferula flava TaxID=2800421 RepID=A0AAE2SD80_9BACT|nr:arylsulfatase [Oceaniferula flavus]MBK1855709.1 arylsulfatase [Oceaniferula flavus]MBM1137016.1 arylsulfatase [Oceaniferula flavus]